jgi:hypothetical protein
MGCRRFNLIVLLVLAVGSVPAAQIRIGPQPTATTGLLGAYALSSGVDASGNNRNLTLVNTATVPGKYADAQRFNGTSSRAWVNIANPNLPTFTLEAWVYFNPTVKTRRGPVLEPRGASGGWQAIVYKSPDDIFLAEAGGFLTMGFTSTTGTFVQVVSPTMYAEGQWVFVAAVFDGSTLMLYENGVLKASGPGSGAIRMSNSPIEIGGSAVDQGWLNGMVDNVRAYSRALTVAELTTDMSTPLDLKPEAVVGWQIEVFPKGTDPATGPVTALTTFPIMGAMCNLAPGKPPVGTVVNPTTIRLSDPNNAGKECELAAAGFLNSVPLGAGWFSTASAQGATTISARSAPSNAFDRTAAAVPPATPGAVTVPVPTPK